MPEIAPVAVVMLRVVLVVATVGRLPGVVSAFAASDRGARDVVTRISVPLGALSPGEAAGAVDNGWDMMVAWFGRIWRHTGATGRRDRAVTSDTRPR